MFFIQLSCHTRLRSSTFANYAFLTLARVACLVTDSSAACYAREFCRADSAGFITLSHFTLRVTRNCFLRLVGTNATRPSPGGRISRGTVMVIGREDRADDRVSAEVDYNLAAFSCNSPERMAFVLWLEEHVIRRRSADVAGS